MVRFLRVFKSFTFLIKEIIGHFTVKDSYLNPNEPIQPVLI